MVRKHKILVSVLNWNNAEITTRCVKSIMSVYIPDDYCLDILVIDNGSKNDDFNLLKSNILNLGVSLVRNPNNIGFAEGNNFALKYAIDNSYEYIWLVNNDAVVNNTVLLECIQMISAHPKLGGVTPCLAYEDDPCNVYFSGSRHNWVSLSLENLRPDEMYPDDCVDGAWIWATAAIYRVDALRQTGLLNGRYFAYFEDNDISERLLKCGWTTSVCCKSVVLHSKKADIKKLRHDYYYYLVSRNYQLFFHAHTPKQFRRFLRIRLLSRALIQVKRLRAENATNQANAALVGCIDGFFGKGGLPNIRGRPSWIGYIFYIVFELKHLFDSAIIAIKKFGSA